MRPTLETSAGRPAWLTTVSNTEAARWLTHCTPPWFYLGEAAHQRSRTWAQSPAQARGPHGLTDTGLAKLLAIECSDWSSWWQTVECWTQIKALLGISHLQELKRGDDREKGQTAAKHATVFPSQSICLSVCLRFGEQVECSEFITENQC